MTCHDVEAAVTESVLLPAVAGDPFAPMVAAARARAEREAMPCRTQAVAHVVVVAVTEGFLERPYLLERAAAIGGVAGADVARLAPERRVPQLEIEGHHPRP